MESLIKAHQELIHNGMVDGLSFGLYEQIAAVFWVLLSVAVFSTFLYLVIGIVRFHYHAYIQTGSMPELFASPHEFEKDENIPGINIGVIFGFGSACIFLIFFLIFAVFLSYAWPLAILLFSTIATPYVIKHVARKKRFTYCLKYEGKK